MLPLLLSIICSVTILIIFKLSGKHKINVLHIIIINYYIAASLGYISSGLTIQKLHLIPSSWWLTALAIGSIYIFTFYLIGFSTDKVGIALTTVASKMSFVFPMFFSILIDSKDNFTFTKLFLMFLAIVSVFLSVYKEKSKTINRQFMVLLPIVLFLFMGLADSLVKYAQNTFIANETNSSSFSFLIFLFASIWGTLLITQQKDKRNLLQPKVIITGIVLGLFNFGSLYYLINALNALSYNNSLVFAVNNTGVVLFSILIALMIFKEKVSQINKVGLVLSILTFIGITLFL